MKDLVNKLEHTIAGWLQKVPHLPLSGQKWLAENIWWLAIVSAILMSIAVISSVSAFFAILEFLAAPATYYSYYVVAPYTSWSVVTALVSLILLALSALTMWVAVKPLQDRTKKGWTLLFIVLLISAVSVVLNAILSLSFSTIIFNLLFGAIGLAISAYFIFEIRSEFAHSTRAARKAPAPKTTK